MAKSKLTYLNDAWSEANTAALPEEVQAVWDELKRTNTAAKALKVELEELFAPYVQDECPTLDGVAKFGYNFGKLTYNFIAPSEVKARSQAATARSFR